jgi:hypothetical protein
MKMIHKIFLLLMLAGYPMSMLFAQQNVLSAGGDASGTGGSVSWSIGQVAWCTWIDTAGKINEGVQQPFEIFIPNGFEELSSAPECIVYPNPTSGNVTLKSFDTKIKNRSCNIYDLEGELLKTVPVNAAEVSIPMDDLVPSAYYLVIFDKDQPVKTYKIIKR